MELTKQQQAAVDELDKNLQLIACAGSGKTTVITKRIVNILKQNKADSSQIVAFTFTNMSADSLEKKIAAEAESVGISDTEGMFVGTIHQFCLNLLRNFSDKYADVTLLNEVQTHLFIQRNAKHCGLEKLGLSTNIHHVRMFCDCVSLMAAESANRSEWEENEREAFDEYRECLAQHDYLDFDMLIYTAIEEIENNPKVQDYLQSIRYLTVDEYQDVDDLQERLISLFAKYGCNICVVGDDDQTIYQFRGSNAENIIEFADRYENVKQINLDYNFRCTPEIIDLADTVITNNRRRLDKSMRCPGDKNTGTGEVKAYRSDNSQYYELAKKVKEIHEEGAAYSDIAILCRKVKYINPICFQLDSLGIPYCSDSSEDFLSNPYVNIILTLIAMNGTNGIVDRAEFSITVKDYIQEDKVSETYKDYRKYSKDIKGRKDLKLVDVLVHIVDMLDFLNEGATDIDERQKSIHMIRTMLEDFDRIYGDYSVAKCTDKAVSFINYCGEEEYKNMSFGEPDEDAVSVMTVHKAKGLEFDTVFITDMEEGEFPVTRQKGWTPWNILGQSFEDVRSKYESSISDERKLFYVAVTRAKCNLYFFYDLSKKDISEFLVEAGKCRHISIDKDDYLVDHAAEKEAHRLAKTRDRNSFDLDAYDKSQQQRQQEAYQRHLFWSTVKKARHKLYDYYGTASIHFGPAAYGDFERVRKMQPDEILKEARKLEMI